MSQGRSINNALRSRSGCSSQTRPDQLAQHNATRSSELEPLDSRKTMLAEVSD